ncbi:unnamed protein product [Schistosoma haematobium]|nr:unnamed protein product [Schistosoma haematobium]
MCIPNPKCFKCGEIGHIHSVCKATVHFASSSIKSCNLDPTNLDVPSDHLSLSTISKGNAHIQKRLYTSFGSFHDFIVDTGSIESIILSKNLKSLDPNVVVRPTEVSILGITGHRLPIRGCCELLIRGDNSSYTPCEFLVSETGLSILGLKNLKRLKVELSFLVSKQNSDVLLEDLIATYAKCSGAIFQEVVNKVVGDLEDVEVYQDDLIVHGSDKVVHDEGLIALLRRLIEKNIKTNPNKCSFYVSSFECLVDGNGFGRDMKRIAPLTSAPSPKNLTELCSLVGALQYYSRFIPNFSCRANCLFNILTSNSFKWSEEQESCSRNLLKFLQSDAFPRMYSPSVHSVLITGASPVGIGAVLEQEGRPVICVSYKLTVTEQGYSQTQREALVVFWAVKRLRKYLLGTKFTIVTDHEAL